MTGTESLTSKALKVSIVTFNCAKLFPVGEETKSTSKQRRIIEKLILNTTDHDVYIFAFQELVPIWQGAYPRLVQKYLDKLGSVIARTLNGESEPNPRPPLEESIDLGASEWDPLISTFSPRTSSSSVIVQSNSNLESSGYRYVASNSVGAVGLMVFARNSISANLMGADAVTCGALRSSLKGAVAMQLHFSKSNYSQKFTFISAHFAANEGQQHLEKRLSDYDNVMESLRREFGSVFDGHVFLSGDLNFRIQPPQPIDTKYKDALTISRLLQENDELTAIMSSGVSFHELAEPEVTFSPTYKYNLDDTNTYNFKRQPSWCDRILYKKYDQNVIIHSYQAIERSAELQFSDHQPVTLSCSVYMLPGYVVPPSVKRDVITQPVHAGILADLVICFTWYFHERYGLIADLILVSIIFGAVYLLMS